MVAKNIFIWAFFSFLALPGQGVAGTSGKIKGRVFDKETNDPVIGANIIIQGTTIGASTDLDGVYFILNVPPGKHTLEAITIGYGKVVITGVEVFSDRSTTQNFAMTTKVIAGEEVVVTARRSIIEKDRTNTTAYVTGEQIDALPVQEVEDIIQLQTGISKDAGGKFHMRGGRSGEIAYMIDGIPVTDQFDGGSSVEIENSWVQELQVMSGTFNAEYGQAQSGVINVVTKSGQRTFSGKFSVWTGDYVSSRDNVFMNIDNIDRGESNAEFSLSGPVKILPNASFVITARGYDRQGWLFGQRRTRREDTTPIQAFFEEAQQHPTDEERLAGIGIPDSLQTGDGAFVPLNSQRKFTAFGNLSLRPIPSISLEYSLFLEDQTRESYSDARRYAPDGVPETTRKGVNHILNLTHTLSPKTFYKIGLSLTGNTE